jgi:AbrB family looped-hinge helix DNA binding protein
MVERAFATLSSKNQIVIPTAVRQLLELQVGDRIEFDITSGHITVKKAQLVRDPYLEAMDQVFSEEWNSVEDSRFDSLL